MKKNKFKRKSGVLNFKVINRELNKKRVKTGGFGNTLNDIESVRDLQLFDYYALIFINFFENLPKSFLSFISHDSFVYEIYYPILKELARANKNLDKNRSKLKFYFGIRNESYENRQGSIFANLLILEASSENEKNKEIEKDQYEVELDKLKSKNKEWDVMPTIRFSDGKKMAFKYFETMFKLLIAIRKAGKKPWQFDETFFLGTMSFQNRLEMYKNVRRSRSKEILLQDNFNFSFFLFNIIINKIFGEGELSFEEFNDVVDAWSFGKIKKDSTHATLCTKIFPSLLIGIEECLESTSRTTLLCFLYDLYDAMLDFSDSKEFGKRSSEVIYELNGKPTLDFVRYKMQTIVKLLGIEYKP